MDNTRPTPLVEDIEGTRRKLEGWLSEHRGHHVSIPTLDIPESTGMSNVTLLFDLHWEDGGEDHREPIVARLQPEIERPVFPSYDLSEQYEVMQAIARHSDIPVPELRGLETDRSLLGVQFYFMKRTEGRIPTDIPPYNMDGWMMHDTTLEQRAGLWSAAVDVMGKYHQLDYKTLGFEKLHQPGKTPLQQQLDYWQHYHDWALEGEQHVICQRALDWLYANQPHNEPTVLCWGDSRLGNIIFNEALDGVAAVLDWEMAVLGNPEQDLAWFIYLDSTFADGLGMPRLEGLPSYEQTIAQWQAASGYRADNYDYYMVFAGMRYGLILSRIMLATGQGEQLQGNFAVQLLDRHLERVGA
ncbi:MAG: phosphotransferase family protein [Gammaproteobacteria bacterium]|jgi:aminoglycoside phosphotransferase (APT) family kinase protein|nr:phosphotransferase family protein [Gammaproteobacteria bacterium]